MTSGLPYIHTVCVHSRVQRLEMLFPNREGRAHVQYATILLLVLSREDIVYVGVGVFVNC